MAGQPLEIERKYLIRRPDAQAMQAFPDAVPTQIVQTYLTQDDSGYMRRIRRRGSPEQGWQYTYTRKQAVGFGTRIELEEEITPSRYAALLGEADPAMHPICKVRWCFTHAGQMFELDVYEFSETLATLEIELPDIDTPVELPDGLEILEDVTGKSGYSNFSLARNLAFPE